MRNSGWISVKKMYLFFCKNYVTIVKIYQIRIKEKKKFSSLHSEIVFDINNIFHALYVLGMATF